MEALGLDVLFMGSNATRLLQGLWVAVQISAISVVLSIILGMLFGIFMTWKNPVAKVISRLYLEIVRIMPQLVLLYIVFFGATRVMGLNISAELSSIIVFVFWGAPAKWATWFAAPLPASQSSSTKAPLRWV